MAKHNSKEFDQLLKLAVRSGLTITFKKGKYKIMHPNGNDMYIFHKAERAVPILKNYINLCIQYKRNIFNLV